MSVEWQAIEDSSAHSSCRRLDSFGRNDRVVVRLSEGWHYVTSSGFRYFRFLFIYNNFIPSGCKPSQYQAFQFRSELLFYSNDDRRYAMNEETQSGTGSGTKTFGNDLRVVIVSSLSTYKTVLIPSWESTDAGGELIFP